MQKDRMTLALLLIGLIYVLLLRSLLPATFFLSFHVLDLNEQIGPRRSSSPAVLHGGRRAFRKKIPLFWISFANGGVYTPASSHFFLPLLSEFPCRIKQ